MPDYRSVVLPYITTVFGGLCQGRMVCIASTVPRSCRRYDRIRFWVDFQCGSSVRPRADVPFRLTATFGASPCVSCSALWNGRWGLRQQCRALSLQEGCLLHLLIHFQEDSVLVVANGNRLLEFKYRRPRRTMDTLKVMGPVLIKVIGFINQDPYHPLQTQYPSQVPFSLKDPALDVPLLSRIESGLAPGHRITIRGQLHADAQEFVLVLSEDPRGGEAGEPREGEAGDVPLRMTVDFRRDVLVRGSCVGQVWSHEEEERPPPSLHPGRYFEVMGVTGPGWAPTSAPVGHWHLSHATPHTLQHPSQSNPTPPVTP
ncbi:galectin-12-like [Pristis pectinata]|uniref:galectin-12-like n=1 Tax=Pristis pectinata TaxID=685728 RepID=UPI00223D4AE4|nr:galectin-12-like [Pristis pectinata]